MVFRKINTTEEYGAREDGAIRRVTVPGTTAFSKGLWLYLTNNNSAIQTLHSVNSTAGLFNISQALGVTNEEKEANRVDNIGVITDFVGEFRASGAIKAGQKVIARGLDEVVAVTAYSGSLDADQGSVGWAKAAAANGATIICRVLI